MKTQTLSAIIQIYMIALIFTALSIFIQILPLGTSTYFEKSLFLDSTTFVYLTSAFFITYSIMQIPGGIFFDRYGIKIILPLFLCITSLGLIMYWFSFNNSMILYSRLLSGVGCSVAYISGIYIAAKYFPPQRLSLLMGVIEATSTLGSLAVTTPLAYMISTYGWSEVGIFISVFCLFLCIVAFVFVRRLDDVELIREISLSQSFKNAFMLLKNRSLLYIFSYSFCTWLVIMSFAGYWLKSYMETMHGYAAYEALWLVEIYWVSFLVASVVIGFFTRSDKSAKRALLVLSLFGFIAYALMFIPVLFMYSQIIIVVIFGGISASGVVVAFSIIPYYVKPEQCGAAVAINNTFVVLGGYLGQVLFAKMLKSFDINKYIKIINDPNINHGYYSALIIYVLFTFLGLIFAWMILNNKKVIANTILKQE